LQDAVQRGLEIDATSCDAIRLIIDYQQEEPIALFSLDGRPHLKLVRVAQTEPPLSKGTPGRDHWGNAVFCLLGGGGIHGGPIIGSTNPKGYRPHTRAVRPEHIHATIYSAMGIDPSIYLFDDSGRPTRVLDDPTPIHELL